MNYKEIKQNIKILSNSQGMYGRLLRSLDEIEESEPGQFEEVKTELEAQNFKDIVDMVLYFEQ